MERDVLIFEFLQATPNSPQQRNEESGNINEFETIFPLLMQRRFGKGCIDFGVFASVSKLSATKQRGIGVY